MPPSKKHKPDETGSIPVQTEVFEDSKQFYETWKHCGMAGFIGNSGNEKKNPILVMMNLSSIPCCIEKCRENDKITPIKLGLVYVHSSGFSKAPYTLPFGGKGKGKLGEDAKLLSEVVVSSSNDTDNANSRSLRLWPFKKESIPGSRGPRIEDSSYLLEVGDVLMTFVSAKDFLTKPSDTSKPVFPIDMEEIPPYSLLEVEVCSKCGDPTLNTEGCVVPRMSNVRVVNISMMNKSLISYASKLENLPKSIEDAKHHVLSKKERFPMISRDVETSNVFFFLKNVKKESILSIHALDEFQMVSVTSWSDELMDSGVNLDIPVDVLLKYTNSTNVQWATTLLELAINMECVSFVVIFSDYYQKGDILSHFRAVPVINTVKMFSSVKFDNDGKTQQEAEYGDECVTYTFNTGKFYKAENGDELPISIKVFQKNKMVETEGCTIPTKDLVFYNGKFAVPKSVEFSFCVGEASAGVDPECVLRGFVRAGETVKQSGSLKRPKFGCVDA